MTLPEVPAVPAVPARKGIGRGALIAIIAGSVVLLLAFVGVAFAAVQLLLGTGQSATASAVAFPSSTVYWTEVAIDPSNAQKIEALRFVAELDAVKDAIEDTDLDIDLDDPEANTDIKKALWDFLVDGDDSSIDTKLDYDDDIAPWLGSRVAFGLIAGKDFDANQPPVLVAVEARDTDAGVDAMEDFVDDLDIDAEVDARNGYVVIATGDIDLGDVYDDGTLDDNKSFIRSTAQAGEWGMASVFVDLGAVYALIGEASTGDYDTIEYWNDFVVENYYNFSPDSDDYEEFEDCTYDSYWDEYQCDYYYVYDGNYYEYYDDYTRAWVEDHAEELAQEKLDQYKDYADKQQALIESFEGTTAFAVARFSDASLEISGMTTGVKDMSQVRGGGGGEAGLPASTIALLSVSGLSETLDLSFSDDRLALSTTGLGTYSPYSSSPSFALTRDDVETWFDDTLALDFPDDLPALFGTKTELVIDSELDFDALEGSGSVDAIGDVAESGAAIVVTTDDPDATVDAWETALDSIEDSVGDKLGLDVEQNGNHVVISGGDFLESVLTPEEKLGDLEAFRRAVPNAEGANSLVYLDIRETINLVEDLTGGQGYLDFADGIQSLGMTTTIVSDDSTSFVLRLTTEAR